MLSKNSKISLAVYAISLVVVLYGFSEVAGFFVLFGAGLLAFFTCLSIAKDIKKLSNSLLANVWSVSASCLIIYSLLVIFYGLGGIGVGQEVLMLLAVGICYGFFCLVAMITGIILVLKNKDHSVSGNPGKILGIGLALIVFIFLYGWIINGAAKLTGDPRFCSMHLELQRDSFIFVKGFKDNCILNVAVDRKNADYCIKIEDRYADVSNSRKRGCLKNVARVLGDKNICQRIENTEKYVDRQKECRDYVDRNAENNQ